MGRIAGGRCRILFADGQGWRAWEAAATLCRVYLSYFELGGGNWTGGEVEDMEQGGLIVGRVSFNGRVWSPDGKKEICV
jgi:hypothetical protein